MLDVILAVYVLVGGHCYNGCSLEIFESKSHFTGQKYFGGYFHTILDCACLLHLIGDKAPPTAHNSNEVAHTLGSHCYHHAENGGFRWRLPLQDEAMEVISSAS